MLESARPAPDPPPFTTLAWRLCHLAGTVALRADYTVGSRAMTFDAYEMPGDAAAALAALRVAGAAWRSALVPTTDADLDRVGRSAFPGGSTPRCPSSTSPGG